MKNSNEILIRQKFEEITKNIVSKMIGKNKDDIYINYLDEKNNKEFTIYTKVLVVSKENVKEFFEIKYEDYFEEYEINVGDIIDQDILSKVFNNKDNILNEIYLSLHKEFTYDTIKTFLNSYLGNNFYENYNSFITGCIFKEKVKFLSPKILELLRNKDKDLYQYIRNDIKESGLLSGMEYVLESISIQDNKIIVSVDEESEDDYSWNCSDDEDDEDEDDNNKTYRELISYVFTIEEFIYEYSIWDYPGIKNELDKQNIDSLYYT